MAKQKRQRWYSAQGQSRMHTIALERSSGTRRLASLIVLLAMILILIHQTSDVKKVEKVATAIGLLPNPNEALSAQSKTVPLEGSVSKSEPELPSRIDDSLLEQVAMDAANPSVWAYQQIWKSLLKKAPVSVVSSLARKIYKNQTNESVENIPAIQTSKVEDWVADSKVQLEKWADIETQNAATDIANQLESEPKSPIPALLEWFQNHHSWFVGRSTNEPTGTNEPIGSQDPFFRGLSLALDERLLEQVVDNSTWWSTDWLPFARSWQRIGVLRELLASKIASPHHFPKIEVSQLLSDNNTHRVRPIRFEGTIYQVDSSASISEAGIANLVYQVIWLKPDDTSNQPIQVYAPNENIDPSVKLEKGSRVSLTGFFFKRIAYKSQRGEEFSPLLLAAYVQPFGSNDAAPATNPFRTNQRLASEGKKWQPPVDTKTPFSIVQPRLQRTLESLDETAIEAGFKGTNVSIAVKPILELERLVPELDFLLQNRPDWPISENASLVRFTGIVTKLERFTIDSKIAIVLDRSHVYRCQIEHDGGTTQLLAASVPSGWLQADGIPLEAIRQPCAIDGLRLARSDGTSLAWTRSPKWKFADGQAIDDHFEFSPDISVPFQFLLGKGWDLAWLDRIRELQVDPIKSLSPREMEPYFALMQLAQRTPYSATKRPDGSPKKEQSIVDLLEALRQKKLTAKPVMERVAMNMRIVRVSVVRVEDSVQAAMLGSDRYYQMDAMADIGNRTYEVKGEKEPVVYRKEYPVTCVLIDVPSWLKTGSPNTDVESASNIEQVWYPRMKSTASGWFYRFWSYKTQETTQSLGETQRQIGPLIVLDSLSLGFQVTDEVIPTTTTAKTFKTISLLVGVLGTLGIWWFVRRSSAPRVPKPTNHD